MIKRIGTAVTFQCDECGDVFETRQTEFQEATWEAKECGWFIGDEQLCVECRP